MLPSQPGGLLLHADAQELRPQSSLLSQPSHGMVENYKATSHGVESLFKANCPNHGVCVNRISPAPSITRSSHLQPRTTMHHPTPSAQRLCIGQQGVFPHRPADVRSAEGETTFALTLVNGDLPKPPRLLRVDTEPAPNLNALAAPGCLYRYVCSSLRESQPIKPKALGFNSQRPSKSLLGKADFYTSTG